MLKAWKSKRQLSLLVALALSVGGGQLFFNHAHAADVTGGDVTVDSGNPAPSPIAAGNAHDIPGATDNRNVTENKLTVDGGVWLGSITYGGYTGGTGNAIRNEIIFQGNAGAGTVYGGWSNIGNATGNTVTLSGNSPSSYHYTSIYGGGSNKPGADVRSGNTLKVTTINNSAARIDNFEKMKFVLSANIPDGGTMLIGHYGSGLQFDWSNITVTELRDISTL